MAISFTLSSNHAVAFPSKIDLGHVLNLRLTAALDNGAVRGVGNWVDYDRYADKDAPATFEGKIVEQAADGNWYVQVTKNDAEDPAVLVHEVEIWAEDWTNDFRKLSNFYNAAGATVRAYVLKPFDIFELSAEGFVGTPAAGKTVTAAATTGKLTVGA